MACQPPPLARSRPRAVPDRRLTFCSLPDVGAGLTSASIDEQTGAAASAYSVDGKLNFSMLRTIPEDNLRRALDALHPMLYNVLGLANMLNSGGVAISEGTQWRPGCDGGASARRTPPPRRRASTWMPYGKPSAAHHFVVSGRVCFCVCGRRHGGGSGGGYLRWLEAVAVEAAAAAARRRGAGHHWCPARLRRSERRSVERALCATVL